MPSSYEGRLLGIGRIIHEPSGKIMMILDIKDSSTWERTN
jgi:hypothetical protein